MDKVYKHQNTEKKWYREWEKKGYFTPQKNPDKKPFTIIMPPPNANGSLHIGHASFLTLEDIMIRFARMNGYSSLWLPGADHAGILTQVVFEKKLEKEKGLSRHDLGRDRFFKECMEFTLKNKQKMENQTRALGASCDWTRKSFTLDPKFDRPIYTVFKRLYDDGLLYRAERMVNWCIRCQTALSDLEVLYKEKKEPLYFMRYGPFVPATVRPETKFGDTAVAVNPKDKRYQKWIGKTIEFETLLGEARMKVIGDSYVDPEFGTGVVKVTPAHDPDDFKVGLKHNLEIKRVIGFDGKLNEKAGRYQRLTVSEARKKVIQDLKRKKLIEKVDLNYTHKVAICERCKKQIEPMVSLQWFIKTSQKSKVKSQKLQRKLGIKEASLADLGILAVKQGLIKIIPRRFEKNYFIWLNNIKDWCISRQIWWGHQLPVWYCGKTGLSKLQKAMNPKLKIKDKGCGETIVSVKTPKNCPKCKNSQLIRDPDTLDTWFSSGQWPYTTLGFGQANSKLQFKIQNYQKKTKTRSARWQADPPDGGKAMTPPMVEGAEITDFDYFYPTSVMETGYEILFFWVARMIMLGLYATENIPFKTVYLHGLVRDALGEKMSKSKGNVIDPLDVIEKYSADSLRMALVYGTGTGRDIKLSEKKVESMRNFSNKLWNIGRFTYLHMEKFKESKIEVPKFDPKAERESLSKEDKKILSQLSMLRARVTKNIKNFAFPRASEALYQFIWHELADKYLESSKDKLRNNNTEKLSVLIYVYTTCLTLLHPFMPYITEEIVSKINPEKGPLIVSSWPE